jgi:hypothetical protein
MEQARGRIGWRYRETGRHSLRDGSPSPSIKPTVTGRPVGPDQRFPSTRNPRRADPPRVWDMPRCEVRSVAYPPSNDGRGEIPLGEGARAMIPWPPERSLAKRPLLLPRSFSRCLHGYAGRRSTLRCPTTRHAWPQSPGGVYRKPKSGCGSETILETENQLRFGEGISISRDPLPRPGVSPNVVLTPTTKIVLEARLVV